MTDVTYFDHGSIVRITPMTAAAREWINENISCEGWQWMGLSLCIDWRFGALVLAAIEDAGFEVNGNR
jgi:hypothetical protein